MLLAIGVYDAPVMPGDEAPPCAPIASREPDSHAYAALPSQFTAASAEIVTGSDPLASAASFGWQGRAIRVLILRRFRSRPDHYYARDMLAALRARRASVAPTTALHVAYFDDTDEALMGCLPCQIKAFYEADVVIGWQGAGMANVSADVSSRSACRCEKNNSSSASLSQALYMRASSVAFVLQTFATSQGANYFHEARFPRQPALPPLPPHRNRICTHLLLIVLV